MFIMQRRARILNCVLIGKRYNFFLDSHTGHKTRISIKAIKGQLGGNLLNFYCSERPREGEDVTTFQLDFMNKTNRPYDKSIKYCTFLDKLLRTLF